MSEATGEIKVSLNGNPFMISECSFEPGWVFVDLKTDNQSDVYLSSHDAMQAAIYYAQEAL